MSDSIKIKSLYKCIMVSKYFQTAVLFNIYGLIAKSISVNEHLQQISLYTAKMLSPVPVCKYFRIRTTITWFTDLQVHSVFAIFSVTDEGVQWVRYIISVVFFYQNHTFT